MKNIILETRRVHLLQNQNCYYNISSNDAIMKFSKNDAFDVL